MSLLMLPFRLAGSLVAWAIGAATVIVVEAAVSGGRAPATLVVGTALVAVGLGAVAGTVVWRMSRLHPLHAVGVLAALVVAFVLAAVLGGGAARG